MHNYYPADFSPSHMGYPLSNTSSNKYVYIKQNFLPAPQERQAITKVLVNPLFNKKVFVNPNYRPTSSHIPDTTSEHMPVANKIHINPRIHTIKPPETTTRKILINPKVLRNIPATPHENPIRPVDKSLQLEQLKSQVKMINPSPKLLVTADRFAQPALKRIRRLSVRSKFKIVRSHSMSKENNNFKKQVDLKVKYYPPTKLPAANKFKLDNRRKNTTVTPKRAKFIFVNKFTSIRDVAKSIPLKLNKNNKSKSLNLLNISGVIYKNSPFSLRRTSPLKLKRSNSKIQDKPICKSKYKLIRKKGPTVEKKSPVRCVRRSMKIKKNVSVEKLRKCNIPCLYYQRFGKCKRKDIGKCNKKHDPDQIALCTKFLQGACIDDNCLLSHNVSSEKMPTCKFYLEGTCSKDQCPYLHVRINPKADICRDFLEGFCRKAQECDKRHQFLCPDYEKKGCAKPRCPYPHGKMVRKYSVVDKHKFAKKSSVSTEEKPREKPLATSEIKDIKKLSKIENAQNENVRYYLDTKNVNEGKSSGESNSCVVVCNETVCDKETSFRSRPKLGDLPSFIAFDET